MSDISEQILVPTGTADVVVASAANARAVWLFAATDVAIGFTTGSTIDVFSPGLPVQFVLPAGQAIYGLASGTRYITALITDVVAGPTSFSGTFS